MTGIEASDIAVTNGSVVGDSFMLVDAQPDGADRSAVLGSVFFNASYANYDHCLDGRLRLVPDADQLVGLRSDYDAMRRAGIVGAEAPEFELLIEQIRLVETDANLVSSLAPRP